MTLELPTFASVMALTTLNYKDLIRICLSPEAVSCVNTGTRSVIQTLFTLHPDLLDPFYSVPCPHLLASSVQTCNSLGEEFLLAARTTLSTSEGTRKCLGVYVLWAKRP